MMNTLEAADFDRAMSMTLHRDLHTGVWYVDQIETRYGPVRNHTRFAQAMPIEEAFSEEFLAELKDLLPTKLSQQIFTISGPAIRTSTVITEDLRLMTQAAKHGVQRVLLRFNRVVGRIMDILRAELRPETLPSDPYLDNRRAKNIDLLEPVAMSPRVGTRSAPG